MAIKTDINRSILNRNNFKLLIDKSSTVEYYVRTVNVKASHSEKQFKQAWELVLMHFFE